MKLSNSAFSEICFCIIMVVAFSSCSVNKYIDSNERITKYKIDHAQEEPANDQ